MTPWTAAHQASLSFTISQSLLKLMSMSQRCHLTISSSVIPLSSCPQSFPAAGSFPLSWLFASKCRSKVFSNESTLPIRRPKFWSFSFSISPSSEYSGLISFRINWFDLLAVQGILKSLLQHHSSKAGPLPVSSTLGRKEPRGTGLWHRWFVFNKVNLPTFILYLLKDSLVTKASPESHTSHSSQSQIPSLAMLRQS